MQGRCGIEAMKPEYRVLLLAGILAIVALWPSKAVMWMTSDSVNYLSTAENLVKHGSLANFSGYVERMHPPGYSVVLAPFLALAGNYRDAALIVNGLSLVAMAFFSFLILREMTGGQGWRQQIAALSVIAVPAVIAFANAALSETLFSAEVLMTAWVFLKLAKYGQDS